MSQVRLQSRRNYNHAADLEAPVMPTNGVTFSGHFHQDLSRSVASFRVDDEWRDFREKIDRAANRFLEQKAITWEEFQKPNAMHGRWTILGEEQDRRSIMIHRKKTSNVLVSRNRYLVDKYRRTEMENEVQVVPNVKLFHLI
jgi:hypothetical protein